ncbi:MAG: hypothetical protein AB7L90_16600 [Hyphomicrobiaceae bacterium]
MIGAIDMFFGVLASVGVGVLLWVVARALRKAPTGTVLGGDGVASAISLLLVACLVVVVAWSVKGGMELFSEPMWGAGIGLVASVVAVFIPLAVFGKLPA